MSGDSGFHSSGRKRFEDIEPLPPTSGPIISAVVRRLGISEPALSSKNAQRYFEGKTGSSLKDSSLAEVILGVARVLVETGVIPGAREAGDVALQKVSHAVLFNARRWDEFVARMRHKTGIIDRNNLAAVWTTYIRLAAIDAAVRIGAGMRVTETPVGDLETLSFLNRSDRGDLLNWIRRDVKSAQEIDERAKDHEVFTTEGFAEAAGVARRTVEDWLHHGARPRDEHFKSIASAIGNVIGTESTPQFLNHLRQFYWLSDVAELVRGIIGEEQLNQTIGHLRRYSELSFHGLGKVSQSPDSTKILMDLVLSGTGQDLGGAVVKWIVEQEEDPEWRLDLESVALDGWDNRIRTVVRAIRKEEMSSMDEWSREWHMNVWGVSNLEAYKEYERSLDLVAKDEVGEALGLVERAKDLDPTDPVYHFTLGSHRGEKDARSGNDEMVQDALNELWLAVELAPEWLEPWTTIGFILLETGRHQEALDHLLAVDPKRDQQEAMYYFALAFAYDGVGDFSKALQTIEKGLEYEPESRQLVMGAAVFAAKLGYGQRARKYRRLARHSGASDIELYAIDWWVKNGRETRQAP